MKKVIVIILFILVLGAGGFGTWYFYNQNQNQIQQNQTLSQQNSTIQAELDAIGALTNVYQVSTKVYSGKEIKESDLIAVSVPVSTVSDASITDMSELVGKYYKVNVNPGTILSKDMLMEEFDGTKMKYTRELKLSSVPVSTIPGDYIDLRLLIPNGEEYVVFSHKKIERMYDTTITIKVSEEEHALLNSLISDLGQYNSYCICYAVKYLEPGNDTDTVAYYPVQHEMENYIRFNPNIDDITRCINESLRDHIDEVFLLYTDSKNSGMSSAFISNISSQYQAQLTAQGMWIEENTDEEGNFTPDNLEDGQTTDASAGTGTGDVSDMTGENFDEAVGSAAEQLGEDLEDLEAIQ